MKLDLEVSIDGFSGPLDLLCSLVESRQMQASKIKIGQLVRIYGAYLAKSEKSSVDVLAEFFFMIAELLLQKTMALLPSDHDEVLPEDDVEASPAEEADFLAKLANYRPYRAATEWLEERKAHRDRCFRRGALAVAEDDNTFYDIGDLYLFSRTWWGVLARYSAQRAGAGQAVLYSAGDGGDWEIMPEAVPEESQIQNRIGELEEKLAERLSLSLKELCMAAASVKLLVVTLLAVLEMCRMGKVYVEQERLFSDVKICAKV